MTTRTKRLAALSLALLLGALALASPVRAQRRGEYMTDGELDLVRDIRRIDHRVEVFLKVADRRLVALANANGETGDTRFQKFGPLPKGSQIDLLDDYRRTIEELMVKFDDEFERKGVTDDLRKGLELAVPEIDRQLKALEALGPKLTQPDADHYLDRALGAAREFRDGAKKALDANPAPPKK
jgi:hypothetical protein